jgi:hypothetical protein
MLMSVTVLKKPEPFAAPSDYAPLLRWLVFSGFTAFAGLLLWRYGLLRLMAQSDRTYISSIICVLYVGASLHCLYRTYIVSREGERERRAEAALVNPEAIFTEGALLDGLACEHIRDLAEKARAQGARRLDQTLLLRGLADRMRGSNGFGQFAADTLMKLGLLGTIIGFIIMLAPIAGLDVSDKSVLKSSMGVMSDGMAVAMYTTLAGLVGSILLKLQYYMLDSATSGLFSRVVRLTETRVVPALERQYDR